MQILIDNVSVLSDKDFIINENILNPSSVILNNVYPSNWEQDKDYTQFYYPKDFSKCQIIDGTTIFEGIVRNTGNISLNPRNAHLCSLQVVDYKTLLSEGKLLDFVIVDKTFSEAVQMVVDAISTYNVVVGTIDIDSNEKIGAYSTLEKSAYDVFQYFANITQSRWTVDFDGTNLIVNFYDPSNMPQGTPINYNNTWFKNNKIIDISYSYGTYDYRNKQIMTSNEVYADISNQETITIRDLSNEIITELPIGKVDYITVNGREKTVATTYDREMGISADFYFIPGENTLSSRSTLKLGDVIYVEYVPIVIGRQVVQNNQEIDRITNQISRNGTITRYENRNDATTSNELLEVGRSYLKYKGKPEIILTVETQSNIWDIGETVEFQNAPLDELKTTYMVKNKKSHFIATTGDIFYTYEMNSNFNMEGEINYFDNQRAKTKGNIKEGKSINRNIDIESSALIVFGEPTLTKVTISGDNTLESKLETPLVK